MRLGADIVGEATRRRGPGLGAGVGRRGDRGTQGADEGPAQRAFCALAHAPDDPSTPLTGLPPAPADSAAAQALVRADDCLRMRQAMFEAARDRACRWQRMLRSGAEAPAAAAALHDCYSADDRAHFRRLKPAHAGFKVDTLHPLMLDDDVISLQHNAAIDQGMSLGTDVPWSDDAHWPRMAAEAYRAILKVVHEMDACCARGARVVFSTAFDTLAKQAVLSLCSQAVDCLEPFAQPPLARRRYDPATHDFADALDNWARCKQLPVAPRPARAWTLGQAVAAVGPAWLAQQEAAAPARRRPAGGALRRPPTAPAASGGSGAAPPLEGHAPAAAAAPAAATDRPPADEALLAPQHPSADEEDGYGPTSAACAAALPPRPPAPRRRARRGQRFAKQRPPQGADAGLAIAPPAAGVPAAPWAAATAATRATDGAAPAVLARHKARHRVIAPEARAGAPLPRPRLDAEACATLRRLQAPSYQQKVTWPAYQRLLDRFIQQNGPQGSGYLRSVVSGKGGRDRHSLQCLWFTRCDGAIVCHSFHPPHGTSTRELPAGMRHDYLNVFRAFALSADDLAEASAAA